MAEKDPMRFTDIEIEFTVHGKGVDPKAVEDLQQEILHLKRDRGIAVLLTDHNVRETLRVTDRSYIINEGQMLAEGTPSDIVRNEVVRKTYLGSSFRGDEFDS